MSLPGLTPRSSSKPTLRNILPKLTRLRPTNLESGKRVSTSTLACSLVTLCNTWDLPHHDSLQAHLLHLNRPQHLLQPETNRHLLNSLLDGFMESMARTREITLLAAISLLMTLQTLSTKQWKPTLLATKRPVT